MEKFNGKTYGAYRHIVTKNEAKQIASRNRKRGFKIRILKCKNGGYDLYRLPRYKSKKKLIG